MFFNDELGIFDWCYSLWFIGTFESFFVLLFDTYKSEKNDSFRDCKYVMFYVKLDTFAMLFRLLFMFLILFSLLFSSVETLFDS